MKNEVNRTLVVKKNKEIILIAIACLLATNLFAQKTYTFDDGVALETDWTVEKNVPSGGTGTCQITNNIGGSLVVKDGSYLGLAYLNKSNIEISITTTASFNNITAVGIDLSASDNSKPTYSAYIVDDNNSVIETLFENIDSKNGFNTGGTKKWGHKDITVSNKTGHLKIYTTASSSGKYAAIDNISITYQAGPPPASTDATLSSLVYGAAQTPVLGFAADQLSYEVELPADYVGGAPSVQVTTSDANATTNITQATTLPGVATIVVTAEDGTTTKTYTVTFMKESANPKVESATWPNIRGTAVIDQVNKTITGQVLNGSNLTLEPTFTGKYLNSQSPTGAQNFANGAISYTFTSATNEQTVYSVTITESPAVSTDATLSSLTYGGKSVPNFSPSTLTYNIELTAGIKTPPTIAATPNDNKASMNITQASSVPGVGKVEVTAEDGTTKLTYTINYTVQVPPSGLTTHIPEIYEAKDIAGGYNTPLTVVAEREYEVFYINRDNSSNLTVATSNADKAGNICDESGTSNTAKTKDGWLTISCNGTGGDTNAGAKDEFQASIRSAKFNSSSHVMEMHIQGYDQFSFYGNDNNQNPAKGKMFEIYIDGVKQTRSPQAYAINRFDITSGEHVIKLTAIGGSDSKLCSFSLRVSQEPRTKWLKGNDSTQTVMQTTAIQPVVYTTKYNNIPGAETRLLWLGSEATGISLTKKAGSISDTLTLGGIANCATGEYNYAVVAYYNGAEKNRVLGKFYVKSDIKSVTSTNVTVYQNEEMDQIEFKYYALSAENVTLTWTGTTPAGITGNGNNGTYLIGGTPTQKGEDTYSITVQGADTTITGKITVRELDYGTNPVLYLYKNENAYESDGVRNYLKNNGWNPIERKAKKDGLRPDDQYAVYKLVVISEDVDANNPEVQRIIQENGAKQPVLNLKGFTYAKGEGLLGWGDPSNGAIDSTQNSKTKGTKIKIQHADHPIFKNISNIKEGDEISILSNYALQGVMPIAIDMQYITDQTLCMGTAPIRKNTLNGYYDEGEWVAAIHEILPSARGGKKYICLPLARNVTLTTTGERLIKGIVDYLVSPTPTTITAPDLLITGFSVKDSKNNEYAAAIDQAEHTITLKLTPEEYQALDSLKEAKPIITHPNYTSVDPASGEEVKLTYAYLRPQKYIITDFINKNVYDFILELYNPQQGIEEVYEAGQWVNIFDIYGRKVATTNEDIYTMELPHGMYIIVTESGETMKIMK